jgi:hypothetical protein
MARLPAMARATRITRPARNDPWVKYRWKPTVTPRQVSVYHPAASATSNQDSPQPQAKGTAATRARNGTITNR